MEILRASNLTIPNGCRWSAVTIYTRSARKCVSNVFLLKDCVIHSSQRFANGKLKILRRIETIISQPSSQKNALHEDKRDNLKTIFYLADLVFTKVSAALDRGVWSFGWQKFNFQYLSVRRADCVTGLTQPDTGALMLSDHRNTSLGCPPSAVTKYDTL